VHCRRHRDQIQQRQDSLRQCWHAAFAALLKCCPIAARGCVTAGGGAVHDRRRQNRVPVDKHKTRAGQVDATHLGELGGEDDGAHGALLLDHHRGVVPRVPHQLRHQKGRNVQDQSRVWDLPAEDSAEDFGGGTSAEMCWLKLSTGAQGVGGCGAWRARRHGVQAAATAKCVLAGRWGTSQLQQLHRYCPQTQDGGFMAIPTEACRGEQVRRSATCAPERQRQQSSAPWLRSCCPVG